jgi:renalase
LEQVSFQYFILSFRNSGISAISCAKRLQQESNKFEIHLFEKSRGVGGRISSKRLACRTQSGFCSTLSSFDDVPFKFDHGAQYFTARDPRFQKKVIEWCEKVDYFNEI